MVLMDRAEQVRKIREKADAIRVALAKKKKELMQLQKDVTESVISFVKTGKCKCRKQRAN